MTGKRIKKKERRLLSLLLAMAMLAGMLPILVFANGGAKFESVMSVTYENDSPYSGAALANGDKLKLKLLISTTAGSGAAEATDSFVVKIPRVFRDLTGTDIQLPKKDDTITIFDCTHSGVTDDNVYNIYTFTYTAAFLEYAAGAGAWQFSDASLIMKLTVDTSSGRTQYNAPTIFETTNSDTTNETGDFNIPDDVASFHFTKSVLGVFHFDGTAWNKVTTTVGTKTTCVPGDVVIFRITAANYGNAAGDVTVREQLPEALNAIELDPESVTDLALLNQIGSMTYNFGFSYNYTNFSPSATVSYAPPAVWSEVSGTDGREFEMAIANKAPRTSDPYALFYTVVKPLTENDGAMWTDDQLWNTITSPQYAGGESSAAGGGTTSDPILDTTVRYDAALQKWPTKLVRNGQVIQDYTSYTDLGTISATAQAGDIVTYGIRITNQGTGDAAVRIGEIVDYVPAGLIYNDAATRAANGGAYSWTADALSVSPDIADSLQKSLLTVTPYRIDPSSVDAGRWNIAPSTSATLYISFTIRDLDEVLEECGAPLVITSGTTSAEVTANRQLACAMLWSGSFNPSSFTVYYNAAEISKMYAKDAETGGYDQPLVHGNDSPYFDIDSIPDSDPFNDVLIPGKTCDDNVRTADGVTGRVVSGKEVSHSITNAASTVSGVKCTDEDDYDFANIKVAPKYFNSNTATASKRFDTTPLGSMKDSGVRVATAGQPVKMEEFMGVILSQLTTADEEGLVQNPRVNSHATGTGDIYGTHVPADAANVGQYYNPNNTSAVLNAIKGKTNSYPERSGAALPHKLSYYSLPSVSSNNDGAPVHIPGKDTVVPYTVQINPTGTMNLTDVRLTDTIPQGFRLLTDINGVPIVRVTRYMPLVPGAGLDANDPTLPADYVNRGDNSTFQLYDVKQFVSYDFLDCDSTSYPDIYYYKNGNAVVLTPPLAGAKVNYWRDKISMDIKTEAVDGLDYTRDVLKINLGDIGYGSYDVTFLLISDRVLPSQTVLTNTVKIEADQTTYESTSTQNVTWSQGAIASFYRKDILLDSGAVAANPLPSSGAVTIRYRIGVESSRSIGQDELAFLPNEVTIADSIKIPEGAVLEDVNVIGVFPYVWTGSTETPITSGSEFDSPAISTGDVVFHEDTGTLSITNSKAMPGSRRYYVTFDVTYSGVAPGAVIKNTAGTTVTTFAPLEVTINKTNDDNEKVSGAGFTAYWADEAGLAPDYTKVIPITNASGQTFANNEVKTGANGTASFNIPLPAAGIAAGGSLILFLKETTIPSPYSSASEVLIKYVITRSAAGELAVINQGDESTNTTGSISTNVVNHKASEETASVIIGKEYSPGWKTSHVPTQAEKDAEFDFVFKLEQFDNDTGWHTVNSGVLVKVKYDEALKIYTGQTQLDGLEEGRYRVSETIPTGAGYTFTGWKTPLPVGANVVGNTLELNLAPGAEVIAKVVGQNSKKTGGGDDKEPDRLCKLIIGKSYDLGRRPTEEEKTDTYSFSFKLEYRPDGGTWSTVRSSVGVTVSWNQAKGLYYGETALSSLAPGEYRVSEVIPSDPSFTFDWDAETKAEPGYHITSNGLVFTAAPASTALVTGVNTEKTIHGDSSVSVALHGTKRLVGATLLDSQFSFGLYEGEKLISSVKNLASGEISFPEIVYTEEGEHVYTIKETSLPSGGISVDKTVYTVTVKVSRENGKLKADVSYPAGGVVFTNTYTPESGGATLRIRKSLVETDGSAGIGGKPFAVRLYDSSKNLIGRYFIYSDGKDLVIGGLHRDTTYYLMEEKGDSYTILGYDVSGAGSVTGDAVGIHIRAGDSAADITVIVRNQAVPGTEIPDEPTPLTPITPPDEIPVIDIPDDPTPLTPTVPDTGDGGMALWFSTASLSGAAFCALLRKGKRKESEHSL